VCNIEEIVLHGINETHTLCSVCESEDSMQKLFTNSFAIKNKQATDKKLTQPVGVLTKEYIEENRSILQKEREEAKKETYEPS
tara:strand:+ start:2439 stop:2687 length:249 start_codon:yes stop_codon:yes gene_type:complete